MSPAGFVRIGRIVKPHGLKGEVAVILAADLPFASLAGLQAWFVPPPAAPRSAEIEEVRQGPKGPLFKFMGVDGIQNAEVLRDKEILVREEELPDVVEDLELDPIGLAVVDDERGELGTITDVIVTGANDVWVVEGPFGQVLIPVIDEVVVDIDEVAGTIAVKLLPGLIDEDPA